jgi:hypothetical protein
MQKTLEIEYKLGGQAYAQQWDDGEQVALRPQE